MSDDELISAEAHCWAVNGMRRLAALLFLDLLDTRLDKLVRRERQEPLG
jgi:hypothetical protein